MDTLKSLTLIALVSLAVAACGQKQPADATSDDPAVQAQIDADAELKAKEEEMGRREAELAL
jgi:predicted small lipoprotein YifL